MGRLTVSSPSSAESNFRELDEVFLQNQTRIWLGEVLSTRFNEDLHISDLLQDGDILFEVSKLVWNLLLTKCMELKHLKLKYGPFSSKRCSGRYRPYSNVDSFIKICKIMGMSGIDLFSPSDVVEKRDIRKVCICIRALSKKARSKQLNVPDFDVVMYSLAMPTDMVGGIRRSLESSQCTTSSNYNSYKDFQTKLKQKIVQAASDGVQDYSSEASDEAESRYMGENSFSSTSKFDEDDDDDGVSSEQEESPDVSTVRDSSRINVEEKNYISDYLAFSDLMVQASEGSSSVVIGETNNMFDFFLNIDEVASGKQRKLSDDEEMEVSSTTSMSSVVGRMLNLEFGEQFDADESSSTNDNSFGHETKNPYKDIYSLLKIKNTETFESPSDDENDKITPRKSSVSSKDFLLHCNPQNDYCGENSEELVIDNFDKDIPQCDVQGKVEDGTPASGNENQDERKQDIDNLVDRSIVGENTVTAKAPSPGKRILKSVVKGTAIAGVLFLMFHIRKSNVTNGNQTEKHRGGTTVIKESKFSSSKQQKRSISKGIYPAEKPKL